MPTAFISYSWDNDAHRQWVRRFATDLRTKGVDAWLDQWEVQLGDDVTEFMERGVSTADHVLLICTEPFATKANSRRSGVGYEQAIVTADLLNSQPPRGRFVCALRAGTPSLAIPRYMLTRLWVDLRGEGQYTQGLDQILVHLFRRYDDRKPPLGNPDLSSQRPGIPAAAPTECGVSVLVAGTGIREEFSVPLAEASKYLGRRLAEEGHALVTGGWPGVDESVARAFSEATIQRGMALEDRLVQVLDEDQEPAFAAGQLVFVNRDDDRWSERLRRGDVVILLGGMGATWAIGMNALQKGTPVLPLADTGSDAKKLYLQMLRDWDRFAWMNLRRDQFQRLARPGNTGIDAAIELLATVTPGPGVA